MMIQGGNENVLMGKIVFITPLTLLDYPHEMSAIFWFNGCNLRCAYCYNPHFVIPETQYQKFYSLNEINSFLDERKSFIDAVVLSGGECTLSSDILTICKMIHSYGLKIKIDTNGGMPKVINSLLEVGYISYVALDFKALENKIEQFTSRKSYFSSWEESFMLIQKSGIQFEVRTTFHSDILNYEDLENMCQYLTQKNYRGIYYIQNFFPHARTLLPLNQESRKIKSITGHYPFRIIFR